MYTVSGRPKFRSSSIVVTHGYGRLPDKLRSKSVYKTIMITDLNGRILRYARPTKIRALATVERYVQDMQTGIVHKVRVLKEHRNQASFKVDFVERKDCVKFSITKYIEPKKKVAIGGCVDMGDLFSR